MCCSRLLAFVTNVSVNRGVFLLIFGLLSYIGRLSFNLSLGWVCGHGVGVMAQGRSDIIMHRGPGSVISVATKLS